MKNALGERKDAPTPLPILIAPCRKTLRDVLAVASTRRWAINSMATLNMLGKAVWTLLRSCHGYSVLWKIRRTSAQNSVPYRTVPYRTVKIQKYFSTPFRSAVARYRPFRTVDGRYQQFRTADTYPLPTIRRRTYFLLSVSHTDSDHSLPTATSREQNPSVCALQEIH